MLQYQYRDLIKKLVLDAHITLQMEMLGFKYRVMRTGHISYFSLCPHNF